MDGAREDSELVRRIGARPGDASDDEAALCGRFLPRALLYGLKHLRDRDRARDLAQAVMVAVLESARAGRIEDPARVDRFVLGICRNVAARMRETQARVVATADQELADRVGAAPEAPELAAIDKAALHHCLRRLDGRDRRVVQLSFHEERSSQEIAPMLQTTPGNVRVLRHRAVAKLRRCLDGAGEPE